MNSDIARAAALAVAAATAAAAAAVLSAEAIAATPDEILGGYVAAARRQSSSFSGFSADRGATFFRSTHGGEWSCSTCHTARPNAPGRHVRTGTALTPLAPAANPERLTDATKVEKWFRRNCNDVVGRECTALEKGDVIAFLRSFDAKEGAR